MLGLATLSIPTLATAQTTVDIVGASLLARGAAVLVTVVVTCDEPFPLDSVINHIDMDISQRAGRFITGGEGGAEGDEPITCDGSSPVTVEGTVRSFGAAFKKGLALIHVAPCIGALGGDCQHIDVTEEIRIQ